MPEREKPDYSDFGDRMDRAVELLHAIRLQRKDWYGRHLRLWDKIQNGDVKRLRVLTPKEGLNANSAAIVESLDNIVTAFRLYGRELRRIASEGSEEMKGAWEDFLANLKMDSGEGNHTNHQE